MFRNQPTTESQSPPAATPKTNEAIPAPIIRIPKPRPIVVPICVAQTRSLSQAQNPEWRMRPPSKGSAGIKLKTSTTALMQPTQKIVPPTAFGSGARPATRSSTVAIATDTRGPPIAIRNSARADGILPPQPCDPPNSQSVIPSIATPSRRATSAWPSSCSMIEAKKLTAAAAAMPQYAACESPLSWLGKTEVASDQSTSAKTISHDQFAPTSIPKTRPSRKLAVIVMPLPIRGRCCTSLDYAGHVLQLVTLRVRGAIQETFLRKA